jgi:RNA polymerase sigma factor (sigma-70 family)
LVAVPSRGRADLGLRTLAPEAATTRELYERHARPVYYFCLGRLRSPEEAEDATQSTFLNAFRALQRGVEPEHESAWLYKIAENVCLTRQRSSTRRRRVETPDDLETLSDVVPAREAGGADELVNLPQALQAMPELQRRAILLREWQGLSYREIAEELEMSQSAVETLLFRGRRALAAGLADEPKQSKLGRLRAGGDAGSLFALLKTLLFSGGAKVALVGAVAASSVIGVSPGVRHSLEDTLVPHMRAAAPVAPAVTPAAAALVRQVAAPVPIAPAPAVTHRAVVHHVAAAAAAKHHHTGPAKRAHKVHPAPPAFAQPTAAKPESRGRALGHDHVKATKGHGRAQAPAATTRTVAAQPTSSPSAAGHGRGHDKSGQPSHGHGQGAAKKDAAQPAQPVAETPPTTPAAVAAPADQQPAHGAGKARGHEKN